MAQLTAAQRRHLPDTAFAIPKKRAYPIPDENHARDALGEVAANGTAAEQRQVKAAVARQYPNLEVER
jgi:hypothetical protein